MTDHRAVAAALIGVVAEVSSTTQGKTDPAALSVTAQAAIVHALLAQVEELRLANLIALLNPQLSTWSHIDDGEIVEQVRAFLDGGKS